MVNLVKLLIEKQVVIADALMELLRALPQDYTCWHAGPARLSVTLSQVKRQNGALKRKRSRVVRGRLSDMGAAHAHCDSLLE